MKNTIALDTRIKLSSLIKSYVNPLDQKSLIYNDNRNKSGIYCWYNNITRKIYIGSSIVLNKRFSRYFSEKYLKKETSRYKSHIYTSMLKHGYNNFTLCILEYCDVDILIIREQYYMDTLNPEYNTMKIAASNIGFKHSDSTIELLRLLSTGRRHTLETRTKLRVNPRSCPVIVKNILTEKIIVFPSISMAAEHIGMWKGYLAKSLNKKGFYKGRNYYVTKENV